MSKKRSLFTMAMVVIGIALMVSLVSIKPAQAANQVGNPDFETGSLSPWTSWGTVSVQTTNVHGGTKSAMVGTASGAAEQVVSGLTPNTSYTLTGWLKTSTTAVTGMLGAKNYGGSEISQSTTSTTYTQRTVTFTTGASNTSVTIYCYLNAGSGYLYCDDYSLTSNAAATATNTSVAPTATRTNTPIPPTATSPAGAYDDEFTSGTLAGKWSWVRQDAANWSLTARSGYMRITCQAGEINGTNTTAKNILLETAPAGDWTVVAKVEGKPTANWAQAGILVYQDDDNWLKVDRVYSDANVFQLGKETGGTYTYTNVADGIASTVSYMKIVKSGSNYSDYYSADGISYTQVGTTQAITLSNIKVGLICYGGTGLTADFDYIRVTTGTPPTATNTPVGPTATRTSTPVPPTATKTYTPVPATATRTNTPVPPTPTKTATPGRVLLWSDEFNTGSVPNTADWGYEIGYIRNNELQYYTNSANNAYISGGNLVIKAIADSTSYPGYNYTSASINTAGKHSWQYGRIEMRAKLPYGKGIWPAFWGMGNSGSWPACGELDIMELIGGGPGYDNKTYGTAHWDDGGVHQSSGGSYTLPSGNFSDAFHIFAIEWNATTITWYVDTTAYFSTNISSAAQSELRQPFYVMLNLAIGGSWPGNPDGTTVFPQYYYIDYVRIYQ